MATLSKHGATLATIERLTCKIAYMSDGKILRNQGDGWKLFRKVKPGVDPAQHAFEAQRNYETKMRERPAFAEYRKALHNAVCSSQRYLVNECLNMLANDPDGVWSELTDHAGIHLDIEEVCELCRLHDAASAETKAQREQATQPQPA